MARSSTRVPLTWSARRRARIPPRGPAFAAKCLRRLASGLPDEGSVSGSEVPSGASGQLAAVHFTDGEIVHGYLNLAKLEEHSFWLRPLAGNARLVQVLQAGFKYFVLQEAQPGNTRDVKDPNDGQTEKKVVVRFLDGECLRTRMDDSFGEFKGMLKMSVQSQFTNGGA